MSIIFVKNKDIDRKKWDSCIDKSSSSLIYGYSWYLDAVVDNWCGLILNDYTCVMPFVWNSKFGVKYIYRPFLVQQLGVFCEKDYNYSIKDFINAIPKKFRHIIYNFNYSNSVNGQINNNYVLNLNQNYNILKSKYSKNTKNYVKKADKNSLTFTDKLSTAELIQLKKENSKILINEMDYSKIKNLIDILGNDAFVCGVYCDNILISTAFFAYSNNTFYYLMAATSNVGREKAASFFLIDNFIKLHANKEKKIDFEGSNIPGVARFFKGWGADLYIYKSIIIDNLPVGFKLLSKIKKRITNIKRTVIK